MKSTDTLYAIIVSLDERTSEIKQLANTLGYTIITSIIQHRKTPDVNFYIGSGKLNELVDYTSGIEEPIDLIIIDGELKPSQWFNLEQKLNIPVYDRIHVILAIFEAHAQRKEAKLQVKLAQFRYERPYVRELIHRTRAGEHPGFMAGGEYQVDDYYEMIKKQIKKIRLDLEKIEKTRGQQRKHRHHEGFYLISLAGYTNAGKSSLMNQLTDANVQVEGKLFSTLSTTTRKMAKDSTKAAVPILLTDTVGFIDDLPSWVVDAFHATLEEIEMADVVLLVIDVSESFDEITRKIKVSLTELQGLNVTAPIILLFNKSDLLTSSDMDALLNYEPFIEYIKKHEYIFVTTMNTNHIDSTIAKIYHTLPHLIILTIKLPMSSAANSFLSFLYDNTDVQKVMYNNKNIKVTLLCNQQIIPKIEQKCDNLHGKIITQKQKHL